MARVIFMFMHDDVAVDQSPEKAAAGMEAVDVEAGEYEIIYDDEGLVYEPMVESNRVRLMPTDDRNYDDLVRRLTNFGIRAGLSVPEEVDDLPLAVARRIADLTWQHRWPKHPRWLSQRIHGSGPWGY